ncbi:hypothetical protein L1987_10310 [Smallanthus sonchifolius]|uniref:Uncharacterized protein n=1 Tax=Smallanthus sonchifolius TaxID=185202 RepID=A0ACB9JRS4_9ASTR|nr:hypothetical protein L1987_10310 [Smallanthus sonchifolius]
METSPTFHNYNHQPPSSAVGFNLNLHNQQFPIQHMFEKPLTPSDVGKLNRLVIPKQHAENYFPTDQQKGSLLSFEDESGKLWRFGYSYWNSSQSYVLTKGWSRYVKEKRLDAGDVVLFQRHVLDSDRMFIGWRRRAVATVAAQPLDGGVQVSEWSTRVFYDAQANYPSQHLPHADTYQRGAVATRRLRLFGVNLECPDDSEPSTANGSSQGGQPDHHYNLSFNNSHHDMDFVASSYETNILFMYSLMTLLFMLRF